MSRKAQPQALKLRAEGCVYQSSALTFFARQNIRAILMDLLAADMITNNL